MTSLHITWEMTVISEALDVAGGCDINYLLQVLL